MSGNPDHASLSTMVGLMQLGAVVCWFFCCFKGVQGFKISSFSGSGLGIRLEGSGSGSWHAG